MSVKAGLFECRFCRRWYQPHQYHVHRCHRAPKIIACECGTQFDSYRALRAHRIDTGHEMAGNPASGVDNGNRRLPA